MASPRQIELNRWLTQSTAAEIIQALPVQKDIRMNSKLALDSWKWAQFGVSRELEDSECSSRFRFILAVVLPATGVASLLICFIRCGLASLLLRELGAVFRITH